MSEKQPTSEMVIIIRPSFKKVCGPDACRAALYNHILYRLARKAKDEPESKVKAGEVFWYASAEDICQDIDEAWCVNKVRKEIKQLVDADLLGQRHNPYKGWDRKYQYFIGPAQGEKLLEKTQETEVCLLHIGLNAEVTHLLHMVNAFDKNGACICHKEEMDLPNTADASTKNGGAIPEGSSKGSTEESVNEGSEGTLSRETATPAIGADAPTPAPVSQQSLSPTRQEHRELANTVEAKIDDTASRLKAIRIANDTADSNGYTNPDELTEKRPAVCAPARTSAAAPPQQRAKLIPARPATSGGKALAFSNEPLFPSPTQSNRARLTAEGKQVLEWYELIRAMKVRRTNENINACNGLSEEDGISFENLKRAIEHWEKDKYVKSHGIAIDLQQLEKPSGSFTFAKAMLVMPREQARNETKEDDNNIQDWTEASQRKIAAEEASGERQRKYQAALKLLEETRLREQAKANS